MRKNRQLHGGLQEKMNGNITSFFFSNFPDDFHEKEILEVFERWGRVLDIFIPKKRDVHGKRFGFVRFLDVLNPAALEKQLDQIIIGAEKLHVNRPKHPKMGGGTRRSGGDHQGRSQIENRNVQQQISFVPQNRNKSNDQVLMQERTRNNTEQAMGDRLVLQTGAVQDNHKKVLEGSKDQVYSKLPPLVLTGMHEFYPFKFQLILLPLTLYIALLI